MTSTPSTPSAVVTGAGSGIGRSIARTLLAHRPRCRSSGAAEALASALISGHPAVGTRVRKPVAENAPRPAATARRPARGWRRGLRGTAVPGCWWRSARPSGRRSGRRPGPRRVRAGGRAWRAGGGGAPYGCRFRGRRWARVACRRWWRAIRLSVSRPSTSSSPAPGPWTMATATARLRVTIGLGEMVSSNP